MVMFQPTQVSAKPIEIIDDQGYTITLEKSAQRIICLYGAYNEILAAMGLESRLIARTKADVTPDSIRSLPSIGTHMRPNVEAVLGLKPDLIIQGAGRSQAMMPVNQLRRQGLNVAVFSPTTFSQLFDVINRLGVLTGEQKRAQNLISSMNHRLDVVKNALEHVQHIPKVFFEVRYPNLLGAGRKSIVNDVIEHAGGSNCISLDKKLVRLNMEALIACNPDAYVVQQGPMNRNPSEAVKRPHFHVLKAIKNGKILIVDEHVYSRPGPRSVDAVEHLARFLHPGAWPVH
jgi:iron complex transport system substrate-binding protein